MKKILITLPLFALLTACVIQSDKPATDDSTAEKDQTFNAPQKAYQDANTRMHAGMDIIDEDADIAFIQGMIPHHQGAVDMANIILEYGDDEEALTLARAIIKAQQEEISWMENWLKERGLEPLPLQNTAHQGH